MSSQHYFWNSKHSSKYFFCHVWMCLFHTVDTPHGFQDIFTFGNRYLIVKYTDIQTITLSDVSLGKKKKEEEGKLYWYFGWLELVIKKGISVLQMLEMWKKNSHNVWSIGICDFDLFHKEDVTKAHHKMQYRLKFFKNTKCSDPSRRLTS